MVFALATTAELAVCSTCSEYNREQVLVSICSLQIHNRLLVEGQSEEGMLGLLEEGKVEA